MEFTTNVGEYTSPRVIRTTTPENTTTYTFRGLAKDSDIAHPVTSSVGAALSDEFLTLGGLIALYSRESEYTNSYRNNSNKAMQENRRLTNAMEKNGRTIGRMLAKFAEDHRISDSALEALVNDLNDTLDIMNISIKRKFTVVASIDIRVEREFEIEADDSDEAEGIASEMFTNYLRNNLSYQWDDNDFEFETEEEE